MFVPLLASSSSRGSGNMLMISSSGSGVTGEGSSMTSSTSIWHGDPCELGGCVLSAIEISSSVVEVELGLKRVS